MKYTVVDRLASLHTSIFIASVDYAISWMGVSIGSMSVRRKSFNLNCLAVDQFCKDTNNNVGWDRDQHVDLPCPTALRISAPSEGCRSSRPALPSSGYEPPGSAPVPLRDMGA